MLVTGYIWLMVDYKMIYKSLSERYLTKTV